MPDETGRNRNIGKAPDEESQPQEYVRRYRSIVETSQDGFWMVDRRGKIMDVNTAMTELCGYTRKELLSMSVAEIEAAENSEEVGEHMRTVIETGNDRFQSVHRHKSGTLYPVEVSTTFLAADGGYFLSFIRDISAQEEAQTALRESERLQNIILNSSSELIAYYDRNLRILWSNTTSAQSVGKTVKELIGMHCYEVWQNRTTPCEGCPVLKARDQKKPCRTEQKTPDGRYWAIRGYPVFDESGEVGNLVEFGLDITDRKRSTEKFRAIADFTYDWEDWLDTAGHLVWVNPAVYDISGYTPEECYAMPDYPYPLIAEEDRTDLHRDIRHSLKERTTQQNRELRCRHKDGSLRWIAVNWKPIYNDFNEFLGLRSSVRDISAQKKAEEEKDLLMKELNHRVKNNLAILSSLISLKNSALGPDVDLSDIKNHIDAIRIIHETLYSSESITHLKFGSYLQNLLGTIFSSLAEKSVAIRNTVPDVTLPTKTAISLGLITNELATNAIKHAFAEKAENCFSVDLEWTNTEYMFSISNSGPPFPEEICMDNPPTLGLRLISSLTTQLNGSLELIRRPHPVFTIRFPIEDA